MNGSVGEDASRVFRRSGCVCLLHEEECGCRCVLCVCVYGTVDEGVCVCMYVCVCVCVHPHGRVCVDEGVCVCVAHMGVLHGIGMLYVMKLHILHWKHI